MKPFGLWPKAFIYSRLWAKTQGYFLVRLCLIDAVYTIVPKALWSVCICFIVVMMVFHISFLIDIPSNEAIYALLIRRAPSPARLWMAAAATLSMAVRDVGGDRRGRQRPNPPPAGGSGPHPVADLQRALRQYIREELMKERETSDCEQCGEQRRPDPPHGGG